jgi:hypothetical protein
MSWLHAQVDTPAVRNVIRHIWNGLTVICVAAFLAGCLFSIGWVVCELLPLRSVSGPTEEDEIVMAGISMMLGMIHIPALSVLLVLAAGTLAASSLSRRVKAILAWTIGVLVLLWILTCWSAPTVAHRL